MKPIQLPKSMKLGGVRIKLSAKPVQINLGELGEDLCRSVIEPALAANLKPRKLPVEDARKYDVEKVLARSLWKLLQESKFELAVDSTIWACLNREVGLYYQHCCTVYKKTKNHESMINANNALKVYQYIQDECFNAFRAFIAYGLSRWSKKKREKFEKKLAELERDVAQNKKLKPFKVQSEE